MSFRHHMWWLLPAISDVCCKMQCGVVGGGTLVGPGWGTHTLRYQPYDGSSIEYSLFRARWVELLGSRVRERQRGRGRVTGTGRGRGTGRRGESFGSVFSFVHSISQWLSYHNPGSILYLCPHLRSSTILGQLLTSLGIVYVINVIINKLLTGLRAI